jgi:hypothetical protein
LLSPPHSASVTATGRGADPATSVDAKSNEADCIMQAAPRKFILKYSCTDLRICVEM